MAQKNQPLLFIDTNIFLDFYRAEGEAGLTLLNHVESVSDSLIITDQVEVEFLSNRQKVISLVLQNLKAPSMPSITPAYLSDSRIATGIERNLKQIRQRIRTLRERFARILKDPGIHDPVFKTLKKVTSKNTPLNLKFAEPEREKIVALASQRYQRGFPPRKKQDHSIGDAVNWEWIVALAKTHSKDVVIVSRDTDFGLSLDGNSYLNDWLEQEFKDRVSAKRRAELSPSLAQALKKLSVPVTPAEEEEEQHLIEQRSSSQSPWNFGKPLVPCLPDYWLEVLKRVGAKSMFTAALLKKITQVSLHDQELRLIFKPDAKDHIGLLDTTKVRALLGTILTEIGMINVQKICFDVLPEDDGARGISTPSSAEQVSDDDVPF